jgi:ABC-2 type transport system ATP-binding protein
MAASLFCASMAAITVRDLHKSYGDVEAVRGIDLEVETGKVFSLLGPNGAGKTTTVEILEGHRKKTSGEVSVLGHDPGRNERAFKERIGIVLQETGVERFLTVAEAIELFRSYYPNPRPLDEVIEVVALQEKRDARVMKLSGGQQRRLDVAIGLAGDPELLFLDEPTTGFDPSARRAAWAMVENLKALGKTVFLTTHYMDEAQRLADDVAIIVGGKIVAQGSPATLSAQGEFPTKVTFIRTGDALPAIEGVRVDGDHVEFETKDAVRDLNQLTAWATDAGEPLTALQVGPPTLEDIYLELTQKKASS